MKKHETKKIRFNGLVEKTDIAIAPLIEQIWKAGIITSYSSVENENKIIGIGECGLDFFQGPNHWSIICEKRNASQVFQSSCDDAR